MNQWEDDAVKVFEREQNKAEYAGSFEPSVTIVVSVLVVIVYGAIGAVEWFLFAHKPEWKYAVGTLALVIVGGVVNKFTAPFIEAQSIRSKRAIRIEAKLDYLLARQKETHDAVVESERKAMKFNLS